MIRIAPSLLEDIARHAERAYPEECCGLLIGDVDPQGDVQVARLVAAPNVTEGDRRKTFEVDPQVRFDLMRTLRNRTDERIVGHYHSHPDHPALPSGRDLEMAWESDLIWLIASVVGGRVGEIKAYAVEPASGQFREIPLEESS